MLSNWWLLSHLSVFKDMSLTSWVLPDNPNIFLPSHNILVIHTASLGLLLFSSWWCQASLLWKSTTSWSQSLQTSEIEETLKTYFSVLLSAPGSWSHPKICITSASLPSGFHLGLLIKDNSKRWKAERKFYPCCFSAGSYSTGLLEQHCPPLLLQAWW